MQTFTFAQQKYNYSFLIYSMLIKTNTVHNDTISEENLKIVIVSIFRIVGTTNG